MGPTVTEIGGTLGGGGDFQTENWVHAKQGNRYGNERSESSGTWVRGQWRQIYVGEQQPHPAQ